MHLVCIYMTGISGQNLILRYKALTLRKAVIKFGVKDGAIGVKQVCVCV